WFVWPCTPRLIWTAEVVVALELDEPLPPELPPELLAPLLPAELPCAAEPPAELLLPPEPEELLEGGMVGARVRRTSLAIRFRSVRTSKECSTWSRPAWE